MTGSGTTLPGLYRGHGLVAAVAETVATQNATQMILWRLYPPPSNLKIFHFQIVYERMMARKFALFAGAQSAPADERRLYSSLRLPRELRSPQLEARVRQRLQHPFVNALIEQVERASVLFVRYRESLRRENQAKLLFAR